METFKSITSFLEEKYKKIQDNAREALKTVLAQSALNEQIFNQNESIQSIVSQNILLLSGEEIVRGTSEQFNNWASSLNQSASSLANTNSLDQLVTNVGSTITQGYSTGTNSQISSLIGGDSSSNPLSSIASSSNPLSGVFTFLRNAAGKTLLGSTLTGIVDTISTIFVYKDGVSETRYGVRMEETWYTFLNNFKSANNPSRQFDVNFLDSTPLDSQSDSSSIYGNLVLGTPPIFTEITDPNNRVVVNTFLKDSSFVSLTPGLPKYNGGSINQLIYSVFDRGVGRPFDLQFENGDEMLSYLTKNGLDAAFANNDKRYYTFEAKYAEYYSYLETMLNTMWIKLGLGKEGDGKFNLFSFFNLKTSEGLNLQAYRSNDLKEQYKSSIGFYVNPAGAVSESANNTPLNTGLESEANAASDKFQQLNFITGMGTSNVGAVRRAVGGATTAGGLFKENVLGKFKMDASNPILSLVSSIAEFNSTQDLGAVIQQFATGNGMKVMYPMLWNTSDYSKNINFTFNFVSPYGDPLSIFQYVYVPFFALLTFALPRQAAENGFVSPFFVRADVPGFITSDLALITDVTWTKGGSDGTLWTKDKLPRAISGSFNITDLYPYLAMVKRLSFMSANPSFTVFLDNMAGFGSLYNNGDRDPVNIYWREMLNRVSGTKVNVTSDIWNTAPESSRKGNKIYNKTQRDSVSRSIKSKAASWFTKR
jgi:hypothetical protein